MTLTLCRKSKDDTVTFPAHRFCGLIVWHVLKDQGQPREHDVGLNIRIRERSAKLPG